MPFFFTLLVTLFCLLSPSQTWGETQNPYDFTLFGQGLNPDISTIGDFRYTRQDNQKGQFAIQEVELALQAPVDSTSRADVFLVFPGEGTPEAEEAYLTLLALPFNTQAKLGKFKADFGRMNRMHLHQLALPDIPLMLTEYFGEEGLGDFGLSLSWLLPNPWDIYTEGKVETLNGSNKVSFSGEPTDTLTLWRLKNFWEIGEDGGFSLGASSLHGVQPGGSGATSILGIDARYKWKPSEHRGIILQGEYLKSDQALTTSGYFGMAKYQFAREWEVAVRYDDTQAPAVTDRKRATSLAATYMPTEFAFYRLTHRMLNDTATGQTDRQLTFQVNFNIGAHGAHEF